MPSARLTFVAVVAYCVCTLPCRGDERLWVKATINGKSVRLAFDTGASHSLLFPKAVERLGLTFTNAPRDVKLEPGESPMGRTEECELALGETKFKAFFGVIEVPAMLAWDIDGVLAWKELSHNTILINARRGTVNPVSELPKEAAAWMKLKLRTNSSLLKLELPSAAGKPSVVFVDTGSSNGAKLPPQKWRTWKAVHQDQPSTLDAYYAPATGLVVAEESWAKELTLGPLVLTDVPVTEASKAEVAAGSREPGDDAAVGPAAYEATLGLAALKRLDFIIDGVGGLAYLLPKKTAAPAYEHNRLGAVFTPVDMQADDLIARVADRSPAHGAGIRDGDILLKIGLLDATKWRTDPTVMPLTQFWTRRPGTKLELTLKRGGEIYKANIVLKQILSAATNAQLKGGKD